MKYLTFFLFLTVVSNINALGQHSHLNNKTDINKTKIKSVIRNFLYWYKNETNSNEKDTVKDAPGFIKGGYPDTTTKEEINMKVVESYLNYFKKSGYVSNSYINDLRSYFIEVGDRLAERPKVKDMVAVPGLNTDWILKTFDTDMILDHISDGHFDKIDQIYNKALARFRISNSVQLLFTLTRTKNDWLIDYIGYDSTSKLSIGRQ